MPAGFPLPVLHCPLQVPGIHVGGQHLAAVRRGKQGVPAQVSPAASRQRWRRSCPVKRPVRLSGRPVRPDSRAGTARRSGSTASAPAATPPRPAGRPAPCAPDIAAARCAERSVFAFPSVPHAPYGIEQLFRLRHARRPQAVRHLGGRGRRFPSVLRGLCPHAQHSRHDLIRPPVSEPLSEEERFTAALAMTSALPERIFTGEYERLFGSDAEKAETEKAQHPCRKGSGYRSPAHRRNRPPSGPCWRSARSAAR